MRDRVPAERTIETFKELLGVYAPIQVALAVDREALLGLGVPDCGLRNLPLLLAELLSNDHSIALGMPEGLSEAERDAMRQAIPSFKEQCDRVSAAGIPESLEHGDLHRGNVLIEGSELRLIDWADSVVTHPFFTLGVTLVTIQDGVLDLQAPVAIELRDAYLQAWQHLLPLPELQQLFPTCIWIGHVARALDWDRMLRDAPDTHRQPYQKRITQWLKRWYEQRDAFTC
jgi:hypothetical protein